MRIPEELVNRRLLEEDPLSTAFCVRKEAEASTYSIRSSQQWNWNDSVDALIRDRSKHVTIAKWLEIAFSGEAETPNVDLSLSQENVQVFIEFHWMVSQNQDPMKFLIRERRNKGFHYFLPLSLSGMKRKENSCDVPIQYMERPSSPNPKRTTLQVQEHSKKARCSGRPRDRRQKRTATATVDMPLVKVSDYLPPLSLAEQASPEFAVHGTSGETIMDLVEVSQVTKVLPQMSPPPPLLSNQVALPHITPSDDNNTCTSSSSNRATVYSEDSPRPDCPLHPETGLMLDIPAQVSVPVKPPLPRAPLIWSQSRQEICESFDWFRSYHGGVYQSQGFVKGYLLSAFASSRDLFHNEGRLIISHGGGKAESFHSRQGHVETHLADDQLANDISVRALLANYKHQRPLVLLIDDKYALLPYNLASSGIAYAVLGFYFIAHAWAEYQPAANVRGRVVRFKFAFQWCDSQGEPWWTNGFSNANHAGGPDKPIPHTPSPAKVTEIESKCLQPQRVPGNGFRQCTHCKQEAPQVYRQSWMCLHPGCLKFWLQPHGQAPPESLEYSLGFLTPVPASPWAPPLEDILPAPPVTSPKTGFTTDHAYNRGFHCRDCGRVTCRYKWERWECDSCGKYLQVSGKLRQASEFRGLKLPVSFYDHFVLKSSGIKQHQLTSFRLARGLGQCQIFDLPQGRGQIIHIQGCLPFGNAEADVIFKEYQEQAADGQLPFRRWPLRAHKARGSLLTNYFSQNAGVPYQYAGGTENTVPFDNIPSAVVKARDLIQSRLHQALNEKVEFNEVLSCAYMSKQKMAFHSDSERGLGPIVAGLSLGSPALMHFRPVAKTVPETETRGAVLSFVLRHGDILVMRGTGVQQYYEHTVIPANFRIAATARFIDTRYH